MVKVKQYGKGLTVDWDSVLQDTQMATFLHRRTYMDYHGERFEDFSLIAYEEGEPVALLPANRIGDEMFSHQGLTYGGFIFRNGVSTQCQTKIAAEMLGFAEHLRIKRLYVKPQPGLFGVQAPLDKLLPQFQITCMGRETTLAIPLPLDFMSWGKSKRWRVRQGVRAGLVVKRADSFEGYWNELLVPHLWKRFQAKPVHSLSEIESLAAQHPIQQWNVYHEGELVGGMTIYEFERVAHAQYTASSQKGRELNAIDFLVYKLCTGFYGHMDYLNLGTSHEQLGKVVKEGLFYWKSRFGAVPFEHEHWRVEI